MDFYLNNQIFIIMSIMCEHPLEPEKIGGKSNINYRNQCRGKIELSKTNLMDWVPDDWELAK